MAAEVEQVGIENSYLSKVVRPVLSLVVEQPEDAIFDRVLGLACTPECPQTHTVASAAALGACLKRLEAGRFI